MISAVFLIFFLETGGLMVVSDGNFFKSMEECNRYAENRIIEESEQVATGENSPHKAIYRCIDWGSDV